MNYYIILSHHLATWRRQLYLEDIRFCQNLSSGMYYRPTFYRPRLDMVNAAACDLHTLMGYRADQSEF